MHDAGMDTYEGMLEMLRGTSDKTTSTTNPYGP